MKALRLPRITDRASWLLPPQFQPAPRTAGSGPLPAWGAPGSGGGLALFALHDDSPVPANADRAHASIVEAAPVEGILRATGPAPGCSAARSGGVATFTRWGNPVPLGWDGHLLLLHGNESERLGYLTAWVRWGLERDEKVIYAADPRGPEERSLLAVLRRRGIEVDAAVGEGRLEATPLADYYAAGHKAAAVERARAEGFRAVRMSAAPDLAWPGPDDRERLDHEREVDQLCKELPLSVLCQYDRTVTAGERLWRAVVDHGDGIRQRQLQTATSANHLALVGEIDIFNHELLVFALRASTATANQAFRLDLDRLAFLSAAGCRAIAEGTQWYRDQGGQLLLVAPRPMVGQVLRIVGIDRLPGVELVWRRD